MEAVFQRAFSDPDYTNSMGQKPNSTQINVIVKLEAAGGSLSLVGVMLIFMTFAWSKRLRTLPNTFIAFASIANVGASIACLIGHRGLDQLKHMQREAGDPELVDQAPLCTTQAFLLEMFMQSDPWWSFAMAFNVMLVFFFQWNPDSFRKWLWLYCLICFGGPASLAVICALIPWQDENGKSVPVYGDATLWCWIGAEANVLRIYTYYLPIWVCITGSMLIYFAVGFYVFRQRNQLRNITLSNPEKNESYASDIRDCRERSLATRPEYYGTKVTEIQITTTTNTISLEPLSSSSSSSPRMAAFPPKNPPTTTVITSCPSAHQPTWAKKNPSSSPPTLSCQDEESLPSSSTKPKLGTTCAPAGGPSAGLFHCISSTTSSSSSSSSPPRSSRPSFPRSFLFLPVSLSLSFPQALHAILRRSIRRLTKIDPVKMAYLRTSFVFAFSVLVTWTPSSILRVHDLVSPNNFSFPLNVAAAIVLPLQGAWNAVIYFSTSWAVVREEVLHPLGDSICWAAAGLLWLVGRRRRMNTTRLHAGDDGECGANGNGNDGGGREARRGGPLRPPGPRPRIDNSRCRTLHHQRLDVGASEVELTRVPGRTCGRSKSNIRAMRGSF